MLLARVIGSVVATQKHAKFQGAKLLVVQPCVAKDGVLTESGNTVVAVDSVGAGLGTYVLFTQGSSARMTPMTKDSPTDAVIVGIVDSVEMGAATVEMPQ
ncbi:MAG TPA: EutN/CcmL family microcompartment protein [Vicinamibacterales bacterium]|nr:EutN/CcmL family microcompartment protein [Vicinamibacterales bacterium]HOG28234.1 EutN/CcmL family microcompartment protein [Vicinamibacterales bacterium]HOQ59206.1 EutN/CcmL family microcompartment protein [Vicinamibacterales bacterium]HPK71475.1 EutN/CcmL family microcompartment protein [Vicinamibacterales bacterium]HPW21579.1 EutN/CcmL family microcompartment protein [Vicinamibacterales bacterium]